MDGKWSLEALYTGYEDTAFIADLEQTICLNQEIHTFAQGLGQEKPAETLHRMLELLGQEAELYEKLFGYCSLRQAAETSDAKSASYMGVLSQRSSETAEDKTAMLAYIAALPDLEQLISQDPLLREYAYFLRGVCRDANFLLPGAAEAAMAKYAVSGGNAWEELQAYLTSSVTAEYDGKAIPLSAVRNLAYDPDASVRKAAYEAELACYAKIQDAVAFALNSIKLQTISECKLRGHRSPLSKTLHEARMRPETLEALLTAMEEYMPMLRRYLKAKGKALGHAKGLPWWDLFAPLGKQNKAFTAEEARAYLLSAFADGDPQMREVIDRAFDENWIDLYPREGKVGGAFCAGLAPIRQFRVLTNFDGSFSSVTTLAHELGHGYHDFLVQDNLPLNRSYSMPVAETASTFNENVVLGAALAAAEAEEEQLALAESELMEVTQIICDIYSRFLFEKAVFENREENFMFPDRLCELMHQAQLQAYGDGVAEETLHPYMWICKSHYYSADLCYYNFPYAFGGLFARGLYVQYCREGKAFLPKYREMLQNTPVLDVEDAAALCGVDITKKEFWQESLASYTEVIELFEKLTERP